ncbi:hypothetical protein DFH08DRAFT_928849 [Mycena albidolilacea]|uniref:receptor protein-tyrosine kinase n=1 Tax=Mycena albidolilacea TaxID=1033008 RepID=A0AAD7AVW5_9AGAR|nr:hypothetical protein DFH08DRAFT_928849 [Mycena albidolilacea]
MNQVIIPHDDLARITYSDAWSTTPGPKGLEHTTSTPRETFSVKFDVLEGGTIEVFGGIRPTPNSTVKVQSLYSIDGGYPFTYDAPWAAVSSSVRQFFNTSLSARSHQLFVCANRVADDMPYYLDYIQINNTVSASSNPSSAVPSSTDTSPISTPLSHSSPDITAIVGGAVGGFFTLVVLALVLFFLRRRKSQKLDAENYAQGYMHNAHNLAATVLDITNEASRSVQVTPFIQRQTSTTRDMVSKNASSNSIAASQVASTSAIFDPDGAIRLGTRQLIRSQDIQPAY